MIHVQSTPEIPEIFRASFRPAEFDERLIFQGDIALILSELATYPTAVLFAGTESGVRLADELSEKLGLTSNGTRLSRARRNKFLMAEAVKAHGLRTCRQILATTATEIMSWRKEKALELVVIKPAESAGTDHISVCGTDDEIQRAAAGILGQKNILGEENLGVVAQELIEGIEHSVNVVSSQGRRIITDIWRYSKIRANGGYFVYDRDDLLEGEGDTQARLGEYVFGVLDALEIANGPSHAEVYMTAGGPLLMEVGARIDGAAGPHIAGCTGYDPLELTAEAYLAPNSYPMCDHGPYRLKRRACVVTLISNQEGIVRSIHRVDEIEALPSFESIRLKVMPGDQLHLTTDVFTLPGIVYLSHDDQEVLERDYLAVRRIERDGLFEI